LVSIWSRRISWSIFLCGFCFCDVCNIDSEGGEEYGADSKLIDDVFARTGSYIMGKRMFEEGVGSGDEAIYVKRLHDVGGEAQPAGTKTANAFWLSDMTGNVWEWCEDNSHENYQGAPTDGSSWVMGGNPKYKVLRGGSWINDTSNLHSGYRSGFASEGHSFQHGFRVAASRQTIRFADSSGFAFR
jgi:hypothetical protein